MWPLLFWGRFPLCPLSGEFLIINGYWILSKAFSAPIEMIIWFLCFNLLKWGITWIDFYILKDPCIPGINPTSSCKVSVQFSHSVVSNSLRPHEQQHNRTPCLSPTPGVHPNPCPLSQWCHPTIYPLSSPSPPALNLSQHQGLFKWVSSSQQVAKVLEFQLQHQSIQ